MDYNFQYHMRFSSFFFAFLSSIFDVFAFFLCVQFFFALGGKTARQFVWMETKAKVNHNVHNYRQKRGVNKRYHITYLQITHVLCAFRGTYGQLVIFLYIRALVLFFFLFFPLAQFFQLKHKHTAPYSFAYHSHCLVASYF